MLTKLVKKKEFAFKEGTKFICELENDFHKYSSILLSEDLENKGATNLTEEDKKKIINKYIGLNVDDVTKYIYDNYNFIEYLKYSFLAKYYERKINTIIILVSLLFVLIGVLLYFILGMNLIFAISIIVLSISLLLIFKFFFKTGESYKSYYNRTMLNFLAGIYQNVAFNFEGLGIINNEELNDIINKTYDRKNIKNNINFTSNNINGNILDLELIKVVKKRHKNGSETKFNQKIFDGFYLKIDVAQRYNNLKGNTIKIRSDETILSSLTEDTIQGIYESERTISFNSEEMNKSFDAKISGYNGFNSVDDMMIQVQKIITPSFEQHLLYLRNRYNSFNMNITDNGIVFAVNMERSLFQQIKHKEAFDFKTTYREANEKFRMLKADIFGIDDFAYYNVFPFLERLYLIKYLTYLYLSYIDFDNYYSLNNANINSFEEKMKVIYTMSNKEFKNIYTDKLKSIKDETKDFAMRFEREGE